MATTKAAPKKRRTKAEVEAEKKAKAERKEGRPMPPQPKRSPYGKGRADRRDEGAGKRWWR